MIIEGTYRTHVVNALTVAITAQRKSEKAQGYTGDSGQVAAWVQILKQLEEEERA